MDIDLYIHVKSVYINQYIDKHFTLPLEIYILLIVTTCFDLYSGHLQD